MRTGTAPTSMTILRRSTWVLRAGNLDQPLRSWRIPIQLMSRHCQSRRTFRSLQQAGKCALGDLQSARRLDPPPAAHDKLYFPQQFATGEWFIPLRHRVASSQNLASADAFLDHPVNEETAVASEQHNISRSNVAVWGPADDHRVSRPNRWQHAPTVDLDAKASRKLQGLGCQFALDRMCRQALRWHHETFLLPSRQLPVVPVFKHRRAVVTNTCSQRNEGFSYGFFCSARLVGSLEE